MFKLIAGKNLEAMAEKLSRLSGIELARSTTRRFVDGEFDIEIMDNLRNTHALILRSTEPPVNDNFMELFLLADAAKRSGAKKITAIVPYLGYGRQDLAKPGTPLAFGVVAKLMEAAGIDSLIALDVHSGIHENFFNIPVYNIWPAAYFAKALPKGAEFTVVSPDRGGIERAKALSRLLNAELAVVTKRRHGFDCEAIDVEGNVSGKHCLVVDDMIDTGRTLTSAAELLLKRGALAVEAAVTHAVSRRAIREIQRSRIEKITIANGIVHEKLPDKFRVLDITEALKDAIDSLFGA